MKTRLSALALALFSFFTSYSQPLAPTPSIGADKMNVVYLGLENPLTIGTSTSWDNVLVSTDNGTISGTGAHRILRPTQIGSANITVVVGKKISTFSFRVKRVPDPTLRLDNRKNSIPIESFKKIKNLSLCYENFDFDLTPQPAIKSASISFTLPNCSFEFQLKDNDLTVLQSIHHLLVPGTVVKIYNVFYTDSSGERSLDGTSYVLY
jgi:hypothetical protein